MTDFAQRIGTNAIADDARLGDIVYWTIPSADAPPLADLKRAMRAAGFDDHPRLDKAIGTAFHQALTIANATMRRRGLHIEARKPKRGAMRVAFVRIAPSSDGRTMEVGNAGHLDVERDGSTRASSDAAPEAARAFAEALAFARTHAIPADLRVVVRDIVTNDARGFAVRPSGGVYFVHRNADDIVARLCAVLADAAPSARITRIAQLDDPDTRDAFAASAQDALLARLDAFRSESSAWIARDGAKRDASWVSRLDALRDIESEAALFEAALSTRCDALRERVAATRASIEAMRAGAAPTPLRTRAQEEEHADDDAIAAHIDAACADDNADADAITEALAALGI